MNIKNNNYQESLQLARRIRAAGIPIGIEEDDEKGGHHEESGLLIRQVGGIVRGRFGLRRNAVHCLRPHHN